MTPARCRGPQGPRGEQNRAAAAVDTPDEFPGDGLASYTAAIAALRQRLIVTGAVLPRPEEPLDLLLLATLPAHPAAIAPAEANGTGTGGFHG